MLAYADGKGIHTMRDFYPATIAAAGRAGYDLTFADFPDCVCTGNTPEEAIEMAPAALAGHIAAMDWDDETLPEPSPLKKAVRKGGRKVVLVTLVAAPPEPKYARRINITMDEGLLDEIDQVATNRSGFLADAARAELARRRFRRKGDRVKPP